MVVARGNVLHHVKREGGLSGRGNVQRGMSYTPLSISVLEIQPSDAQKSWLLTVSTSH